MMSTFEGELGWLDGTIECFAMSITGYTKEQIDSLGGINEVMLDEMVTTCRSIDDLMENMSGIDSPNERC
jgi:hypothetical protein